MPGSCPPLSLVRLTLLSVVLLLAAEPVRGIFLGTRKEPVTNCGGKDLGKNPGSATEVESAVLLSGQSPRQRQHFQNGRRITCPIVCRMNSG